MLSHKIWTGAGWVVPLAWTAAAVLATVGCGSNGLKTYPVTAKVAFPDGQVPAGAIVTFRSVADPKAGTEQKSYTAIAKVGPDGTCQPTTSSELGDGLVAGRHCVSVRPPPGFGGPGALPRPVFRIHPRFYNPATSGLEVTVSPGGSKEFEIQVEPP